MFFELNLYFFVVPLVDCNSEMKIILNHILSVSISILILITGSGYTISKMECRKSGHSTISIGLIKDCCDPGSGAPCHYKKKCCQITTTLFKANPFVLLKLKSMEVIKIFLSDFAHATLGCFLSTLNPGPSTVSLSEKSSFKGIEKRFTICSLQI